MKKKEPIKRGEPATQFDQIYREYHDPKTKEYKKILNNRKIRQEDNKKDLGI